jgi:hypothetical protein
MLRTRHALFVFALVIAITGDSSAQQFSPSPRPESQPPQSQAGQLDKRSVDSQRGSESAPLIIKILPPAPTEQEPAARHQEELGKAATDKKIADLTELLSYATTALAVIAVFQLLVFGWQGYHLWRTVDHLAISERAHVSAGANRGKIGNTEVLVVTINNYGKTPASIGTVAATICEEAELSSFPGWGVNEWDGHSFVKEWKGYVFGQVDGQRTDVVLPFQAGKVIAGRIWYRDIFNRRYSVGFALKTDDLTAVGNREPFWEERKEKNLRP